jgi:hypothetical protein
VGLHDGSRASAGACACFSAQWSDSSTGNPGIELECRNGSCELSFTSFYKLDIFKPRIQRLKPGNHLAAGWAAVEQYNVLLANEGEKHRRYQRLVSCLEFHDGSGITLGTGRSDTLHSVRRSDESTHNIESELEPIDRRIELPSPGFHQLKFCDITCR